MPGNGFSFAIEVGREINRFGFAGCFNNFINVLFTALAELVVHGETIINIDGAVSGRQVAYMTIGRQYLEILAEVPVNSFRLGRRFHDE